MHCIVLHNTIRPLLFPHRHSFVFWYPTNYPLASSTTDDHQPLVREQPHLISSQSLLNLLISIFPQLKSPLPKHKTQHTNHSFPISKGLSPFLDCGLSDFRTVKLSLFFFFLFLSLFLFSFLLPPHPLYPNL